MAVTHLNQRRKCLIVGFEGGCCTGKSTLIAELSHIFGIRGIQTFIVDEYTKFVNGHQNFPPLVPKSYEEAVKNARFFLDVERKRRNALENFCANNQTDQIVIFLDRTIFTVAYLCKLINDMAGYAEISQAIMRCDYLRPDILYFIPPPSRGELLKRLNNRERYPGWEYISKPISIDMFSPVLNLAVDPIRTEVLPSLPSPYSAIEKIWESYLTSRKEKFDLVLKLANFNDPE